MQGNRLFLTTYFLWKSYFNGLELPYYQIADHGNSTQLQHGCLLSEKYT